MFRPATQEDTRRVRHLSTGRVLGRGPPSATVAHSVLAFGPSPAAVPGVKRLTRCERSGRY